MNAWAQPIRRSPNCKSSCRDAAANAVASVGGPGVYSNEDVGLKLKRSAMKFAQIAAGTAALILLAAQSATAQPTPAQPPPPQLAPPEPPGQPGPGQPGPPPPGGPPPEVAMTNVNL